MKLLSAGYPRALLPAGEPQPFIEQVNGHDGIRYPDGTWSPFIDTEPFVHDGCFEVVAPKRYMEQARQLGTQWLQERTRRMMEQWQRTFPEVTRWFGPLPEHWEIRAQMPPKPRPLPSLEELMAFPLERRPPIMQGLAVQFEVTPKLGFRWEDL